MLVLVYAMSTPPIGEDTALQNICAASSATVPCVGVEVTEHEEMYCLVVTFRSVPVGADMDKVLSHIRSTYDMSPSGFSVIFETSGLASTELSATMSFMMSMTTLFAQMPKATRKKSAGMALVTKNKMVLQYVPQILKICPPVVPLEVFPETEAAVGWTREIQQRLMSDA